MIHKRQNKPKTKTPLVFTTTYNPCINHGDLNRAINKYWSSIQYNETLSRIFPNPPFVAYKKDQNIPGKITHPLNSSFTSLSNLLIGWKSHYITRVSLKNTVHTRTNSDNSEPKRIKPHCLFLLKTPDLPILLESPNCNWRLSEIEAWTHVIAPEDLKNILGLIPPSPLTDPTVILVLPVIYIRPFIQVNMTQLRI